MLRRIQAQNYRCMRDLDVELDTSFHVLVGPNGSGKSALLDIIAFVSDLVASGLDVAIRKRTKNFQDLVWRRPRNNPGFKMALEFDLSGISKNRFEPVRRLFRYEVGIWETRRGAVIYHECGLLLCTSTDEGKQQSVEEDGKTSIFTARNELSRDIFFMRDSESGYYRNEHEFEPVPGDLAVRFDQSRSAFDRIPESPQSFPVTAYARRFLAKRIRPIFLETRELCRASPPLSRHAFLPAGSNLPWVVQRMQEDAPEQFEDWLGHIRTARPDIQNLQVIDRDDDRHAYLMIQYQNGVCVPSWSISDGTLRLLALTLIAYLPDPGHVYLLEEPENGVHPLAIEAIYQSLSSVYGSQVLATTHSPVLLRCMEPKEIICFTKDSGGAAIVVSGSHHPMLANCQSAIDTELIFATEFF